MKATKATKFLNGRAADQFADAGCGVVCAPAGRSVTQTAEESLHALREAYSLVDQLDAAIFGPSPTAVCGDQAGEFCGGLTHLIDEGNAAATGLVKRLRNILERL